MNPGKAKQTNQSRRQAAKRPVAANPNQLLIRAQRNEPRALDELCHLTRDVLFHAAKSAAKKTGSTPEAMLCKAVVWLALTFRSIQQNPVLFCLDYLGFVVEEQARRQRKAA